MPVNEFYEGEEGTSISDLAGFAIRDVIGYEANGSMDCPIRTVFRHRFRFLLGADIRELR